MPSCLWLHNHAGYDLKLPYLRSLSMGVLVAKPHSYVGELWGKE